MHHIDTIYMVRMNQWNGKQFMRVQCLLISKISGLCVSLFAIFKTNPKYNNTCHLGGCDDPACHPC